MKHSWSHWSWSLPSGIFFALFGAHFWLFLPVEPAALLLHRQTMTGGFVLAFVTGVLLTLLPHLAPAPGPTPAEQSTLKTCVLFTGILSLTAAPILFHSAMAVTLAVLLLVIGRSYGAGLWSFASLGVPLALGILAGIAGSVLLAFSSGQIDGFALRLGGTLQVETLTLLVTMGLGSRLLPTVTGFNPAHALTRSEAFAFPGLILIGTLLEAGGFVVPGGLLKVGAATWMAYRFWGLFHPLRPPSRLGWGLILSASMVIVALWMSWFLPGSRSQWMHVHYMGGFGLMILMVSSRLAVTHGHQDFAQERRSTSITLVSLLLATATFLRILGPMTVTQAEDLYRVSALAWIVGLGIWSRVFVLGMYKIPWFSIRSRGSSPQPQGGR